MLVEQLTQVPEFLFKVALRDALHVDWECTYEDRTRKRSTTFSTSASVPLRIHDTDETDLSVLEYGELIECRDTPVRSEFPGLNLLIAWMCHKVRSKHLGRIQLVRLSGHGEVPLHIDPGTYFQVHDRLHVPLITDGGTVFFSPTEEARMPLGVLCRLNNRDLHGVRNMSDAPRVHLIVDIQTKEHPWASA